MVTSYGRFKDFEIRDVMYLGDPPDNKIRFDIVKWWKDKTAKKEYCFSIGELVWNEKEAQFEFNGCGLRWLDCSTEELNQWVLKWCEAMEYKIIHEGSEND